MVWFHKPVRAFYPTPRDVFGQDELTVSAWHTPGKELKFETNHPEFRTMKITSAGPMKTFWFNGEEKATVNFDTSSKYRLLETTIYCLVLTIFIAILHK